MPDPYAWPLDDIVVVVPLHLVGYAILLRWFPTSRLRIAAFAAANVLLLVAFATPVDTIALHYLLSVHLLQNVIAAEWAPGLIVFGLPPAFAAVAEARVPLLRILTHPLVGLPIWLATYASWHVPAVYDFYSDGPGLWGLSALTDQQIAGVTMASEQAAVFFAVFAYWFLRFLREQEEEEESLSAA